MVRQASGETEASSRDSADGAESIVKHHMVLRRDLASVEVVNESNGRTVIFGEAQELASTTGRVPLGDFL